MPSIFPLEIEEMILDLLAEDDEDHLALKMCSLVCQSFLPICRKHIFKSIRVAFQVDDHNLTSSPTHAFERLLRETPEIADYIRKLDLSIPVLDLTRPSIQESLKRISRLEFLTLRDHNVHNVQRLDWSSNPIRPALLHLLHLPTLTHFKVNHIEVFAVSDFIPCVNLKYLDIAGGYTFTPAENTFPSALPEHSIQLNEFVTGYGASAAAIMELCTARRPDGQPIIDFGSLSKITVAFIGLNESRALQELFRHCHVLTNVSMSFWDPQDVRPNLADMLRPSMQTLKHIVVHFYDVEVDDDPFFGIPSEFEDMCTNNIIETVTIGIHRMDAKCRGGDYWCRLDEALTTPGWFSLKRVSLTMEIRNYLGRNYELEVAQLQKLRETQFPRLLSSNSILFDFEVIEYPKKKP